MISKYQIQLVELQNRLVLGTRRKIPIISWRECCCCCGHTGAARVGLAMQLNSPIYRFSSTLCHLSACREIGEQYATGLPNSPHSPAAGQAANELTSCNKAQQQNCHCNLGVALHG